VGGPNRPDFRTNDSKTDNDRATAINLPVEASTETGRLLMLEEILKEK
jgi:hypothetical protein